MTEETWAPFSTWNAKEYVTCFRAVWSIYVGHCAPLLSPEGGQLLPHGRTSLIRSHSLAAGFALLHWSFHYTQLTSAPLWTPLPQPLSPCLDVHSHPCPLAPGAVTFSVKWESRTSSSAFCPGRASHNVGLLTGSHSFLHFTEKKTSHLPAVYKTFCDLASPCLSFQHHFCIPLTRHSGHQSAVPSSRTTRL